MKLLPKNQSSYVSLEQFYEEMRIFPIFIKRKTSQVMAMDRNMNRDDDISMKPAAVIVHNVDLHNSNCI
ncbi:hypothetical protein B9Z55_027324 [Caenorhabditis nigoni]|uniref:Uncharacterized protein n=1 Tax=Caenorhabditis nigoni TaxID=1611254 RepID=A0A2G5SGJ4_9PELO|nr:hypothetical protein B9Z55_027324 [Caenorhabditis nigoni]